MLSALHSDKQQSTIIIILQRPTRWIMADVDGTQYDTALCAASELEDFNMTFADM